MLSKYVLKLVEKELYEIGSTYSRVKERLPSIKNKTKFVGKVRIGRKLPKYCFLNLVDFHVACVTQLWVVRWGNCPLNPWFGLVIYSVSSTFDSRGGILKRVFSENLKMFAKRYS